MPEPEQSRDEFERLLRETYVMVYQVAYTVLVNGADAEDVTQEVFLRAYRKFSGLCDRQKFRGWVARIGWRLALNRLRSRSRAVRRDGAWLALQKTGSDPESEAAGREFATRLEEQIAQLPEKLRSVVLLSAVEGLDAATVATVLHIPEGTVRSRLFLARRQLMRALCQ